MTAMKSRDEARAAVVEHLRRRGVGGTEGIAFFESATIEKPYGWIFFYNSPRYVETGELMYALVGQGPVVVVAETREVIELGSARPSEVAIQELEDRLQLGRAGSRQ
jgi:hypothetical protein